MFLKIDESSYINLYQVTKIVTYDTTTLTLTDADNIPIERGWVVAFLLPSLKYSTKSPEKDEKTKEVIAMNYNHIQDYHILSEVFNTKTEAEAWIENALGALLQNSRIRVN